MTGKKLVTKTALQKTKWSSHTGGCTIRIPPEEYEVLMDTVVYLSLRVQYIQEDVEKPSPPFVKG